jgi:hypothetical protein
MDIDMLREAALAATGRVLAERHGIAPSEDSDEWEEEYRRQFAALKQRYGNDIAVAPRRVPAAPERQLPELSGTPEQKRWAASIRAERLPQLPNEGFRQWMARSWTRAKVWVDTRDVPTATLVQRLKPQYDEYRRQTAEAAKTRAAEAQQKAAEAVAFQAKLKAAGITPEDLVELVDASDRFDLAPIAAKLAEIAVERRHLRIFETSDPNLLLVKEKNDRGQLDYAIERDEGLVADLKLFAQAP